MLQSQGVSFKLNERKLGPMEFVPGSKTPAGENTTGLQVRTQEKEPV